MAHSPLLLQLVIILGAARLLGLVLRYFGQPAVIGEMAAGIMLGPIVFGAIAPELHAHVFEPASRGALEGLSQLGLVLFMFIVGAEFRLPTGARSQIVAARLGWRSVRVAADGARHRHCLSDVSDDGVLPVSFWPFALFMAVGDVDYCLPSDGAHPARIATSRRLPSAGSRLTSAAVVDVLAWVLLALVVVLASTTHDWMRSFGRSSACSCWPQ